MTEPKEAAGPLTSGPCPGCGQAVLLSSPAGLIYGTGGALHTCPDPRAAGQPRVTPVTARQLPAGRGRRGDACRAG